MEMCTEIRRKVLAEGWADERSCASFRSPHLVLLSSPSGAPSLPLRLVAPPVAPLGWAGWAGRLVRRTADQRRHAPFARVRPSVSSGPFLPPRPYAATWANVGACVPACGRVVLRPWWRAGPPHCA